MREQKTSYLNGISGVYVSEKATRFSAEYKAPVYYAFKEDRQVEILGQYTNEQQKQIRYRQQILSSLPYFIGKDFKIPIELNEPGAGWCWDFQENKIRIDPQDLIEKPMDYLRFVISHEGGHRRITRVNFIPENMWNQPGFSIMMNTIEDPRVNNFIVESYPKIRKPMEIHYQMELAVGSEARKISKDKLGYVPRSVQAGWEYIKQWFKETQGQEFALTEDLPDDVREVVQTTLNSARESWLHYPTKQEADESEGNIQAYAKSSYEINRDEIWPKFKTLIDKDLKDQNIQELMQDMQQGDQGKSGENFPLPPNLDKMLNKTQKEELSDALKKASQQAKERAEKGGKEGAIVDLESLSPELKQKLSEYMDSLDEDTREKLKQKAQETLEELETELNKQFEEKLSEIPAKNIESEKSSKSEETSRERDIERKSPTPADKQEELEEERDIQESESVVKFKEEVDKVFKKDMGIYENNRKEVLPVIDSLERDLRELFVQRRAHNWKSGFKTGKRIDINRRMQEKALGISSVESKAWQKRELPQEKDYAISLLVDLSGSMRRHQKIQETFKGVVALAEVLNRLSIKTEILGFNDDLYEYQVFGQDMSQSIRDHMGGMLKEVDSEGASYNDDGWAVQQASNRLAKQREEEKFLLILSDGNPEESKKHSRKEYELGSIVKKITKKTDQKIIGLGIGEDTDHVEKYYPNSIANISVNEMADKLADVIREAITNYDSF